MISRSKALIGTSSTSSLPLSAVTVTTLTALGNGFDVTKPPVAVTVEPKSREDELFDSLTAREKEILLLADSHGNQTVADCLFLCFGTVKAHNHNIFSKLGVNSRSQAITCACELQLI